MKSVLKAKFFGQALFHVVLLQLFVSPFHCQLFAHVKQVHVVGGSSCCLSHNVFLPVGRHEQLPHFGLSSSSSSDMRINEMSDGALGQSGGLACS